MPDSSSLTSLDPQGSFDPLKHSADIGYTAIDAAYRFAVVKAGPQAARRADQLSVVEVIADTLVGVAHLCDQIGVDTQSVFAHALDCVRYGTPHATLDPRGSALAPEAFIHNWSGLCPPASTAAAHATTVLTLLRDRPEGVTSTELRSLGVKNPSNVVLNLIRAGHPISRTQVQRNGTTGREARYVLDRARA